MLRHTLAHVLSLVSWQKVFEFPLLLTMLLYNKQVSDCDQTDKHSIARQSKAKPVLL